MKTRQHATIWALMAACTCACSQDMPRTAAPGNPGDNQAPAASDPQIVKRPPAKLDPRAVERPPSNVDPDIAKAPPAERAVPPERKARPEKKSKGDDCRGSADLCKENSER